MNIIKIENFGPVKSAIVDENKIFQVFIGPQASGKSTVCKVVYFCQKIRDYTLEFLLDSEQFYKNHKNEYFNNYMKFLTGKFMECFGKTTHMRRFCIEYCFSNKSIRIKLNKDGYVRYEFDENLKEEIASLIHDVSHMYNFRLNSPDSLLNNVTAIGMMRQQLQKALFNIFANDAEIVYIPAGRSLLATLSDQLYDLSFNSMDLTMREFIHLVRITKNKFGSKIPEMVKDYTKTVKGQINNGSVEQAYNLIRKILKAEYISESDGEKIYFDDRHWVKLMYGSSGQQEVLWILMIVFINILENKKSFVIIEEPEAHLFPIAQKDVVELISLMVNTTNSKVILTTHSPYILTSLNILLYSGRIENQVSKSGKAVISKNMRISYQDFEAYKICGKDSRANELISLMDEESHLIDTEYIDEVSNITNRELDHLISMEIENDL